MDKFNFYTPIQVRYGDLDPQWHVNNARFLTFMEQSRILYLKHLGLFSGNNFLQFPLIVADAHIVYKAPINMDEPVRVGVGISRIGTKSMVFEVAVENAETLEVKAKAEFIIVNFDYEKNETVRVSDEWRRIISKFEGKAF